MTKTMTGPQAQLNLSVVALVALVAIVGLVALVLNSPLMGASVANAEPSLESAAEVNTEEVNLAGQAAYCAVWAEYRREVGPRSFKKYAPDICQGK